MVPPPGPVRSVPPPPGADGQPIAAEDAPLPGRATPTPRPRARETPGPAELPSDPDTAELVDEVGVGLARLADDRDSDLDAPSERRTPARSASRRGDLAVAWTLGAVSAALVVLIVGGAVLTVALSVFLGTAAAPVGPAPSPAVPVAIPAAELRGVSAPEELLPEGPHEEPVRVEEPVAAGAPASPPDASPVDAAAQASAEPAGPVGPMPESERRRRGLFGRKKR